MKFHLIVFISMSIFFTSCGKKEETQQKTQQKDINGQTQQQTTQQDVKKTEETKSDNNTTDAGKKQEPKPVTMDPITGEVKKIQQNDIDFAVIYTKKCAKCHGRDGHGKPDGAPSLTAESTRSKSDNKLFQIISKGVKNPDPNEDDMPAWKGKLSDDEINAGIKYIRNIP